MKYCEKCGQQMNEDVKNCPVCQKKQIPIIMGNENLGDFKKTISGLKIEKAINKDTIVPFGNILIDVFSEGMTIKTETEEYLKINEKNIRKLECENYTEVIEKGKSVIGRAAAGGILLGPAGLVIGGLSGVGHKKAEKEHTILELQYEANDGTLNGLGIEGLYKDVSIRIFSRAWNDRKKTKEEFDKLHSGCMLLIIGITALSAAIISLTIN